MATKKYWDGYDLDKRRERSNTATAGHSLTYPARDEPKHSVDSAERRNGGNSKRSGLPVQWVSEYKKNFTASTLQPFAQDFRRRRPPSQVRLHEPVTPATNHVFRDKLTASHDIAHCSPPRPRFQLQPLGTLDGSAPAPRARSASFSIRFQHVQSKVETGLRRSGAHPEIASPQRRGCVSLKSSPDMKRHWDSPSKSPLRPSIAKKATLKRSSPDTSSSSRPSPRLIKNKPRQNSKELTTTQPEANTLVQPGGPRPPPRKPSPKVVKRTPATITASPDADNLPAAFSFADFMNSSSDSKAPGPKPIRGGDGKPVISPIAEETEPEAETVSAHHSARTPTPDSSHTLTNEVSADAEQDHTNGTNSYKFMGKMPESDSATDLSHDSRSIQNANSSAGDFVADDGICTQTDNTPAASNESLNSLESESTARSRDFRYEEENSNDSGAFERPPLRSVSPGNMVPRADTWASPSSSEVLTFKPHARRSSGVDVSLEVETRPALNKVPRVERESTRSPVEDVSPDRLLAARAANAAAVASLWGPDSPRLNDPSNSMVKKLYGTSTNTTPNRLPPHSKSNSARSVSPLSQSLPTILEAPNGEDVPDDRMFTKRVGLDQWAAGY